MFMNPQVEYYEHSSNTTTGMVRRFRHWALSSNQFVERRTYPHESKRRAFRLYGIDELAGFTFQCIHRYTLLPEQNRILIQASINGYDPMGVNLFQFWKRFGPDDHFHVGLFLKYARCCTLCGSNIEVKRWHATYVCQSCINQLPKDRYKGAEAI